LNILIVYGCRKNGNTHHCIQIIKKHLEFFGQVIFKEVWLSEKLTKFCTGCFNCINRGENYCPHSESVSSITEHISMADGIILASPVYGLNVSGVMKNFIDHLCFMWIPHRPRSEMFSKVGLVVSTTAGTGTKYANQTMKRTLDYIGINRTYTYGKSVSSCCWADITEQKKVKILKQLQKKSQKFYVSILKRDKLRTKLFTLN